ncbi:MAG TPA: isoprenylcysteine carboxylmethyltransferase family protein [Kofleriaceae bacterium]
MSRIAALVYGGIAYLGFLAVTLYAIGFVGNFHVRIADGIYFVPQAVDLGRPAVPTLEALLIDGALLLLFAVQHSGMARQSAKSRLTRFISPAIERTTYVMATNVVLALLFWQWRAIGGTLWAFGDGTSAAVVLRVLNLGGWVLAFVATFLINHLELFGLQQVYAHARGAELSGPTFRQPYLYRWIRHPLYLGFLIAFWATPVMTWGHVLFSVAATGYILVGVQLEERDLIRVFGDRYREYRQRVPMLLPRPGSRQKETV